MFRDPWRALIGLLLVPYHLLRLAYLALLVSYAAVFARADTLTASPEEHLKRARRMVRRGRKSDFLYIAVELRFALERMVDFELSVTSGATRRMLDEPDPVKQLRNQRRLEPRSAAPHRIVMVNKETDDRVDLGTYVPLDEKRISELNGRLGDLLHPKVGIPLGVPNHLWYTETQKFLKSTAQYLLDRYRASTPLVAYAGLDHIELVLIE